MFISFTEGFLLGLGAAIPLGPINILIMNRALRDYKSAVAIGFGALSADTFYLSLILLGLFTFLNHPFILNILAIFGSIFLIYMAYMIFKNRNRLLDTLSQQKHYKSLLKFYLQGFSLTLLNPYTVAFWLSIASYTTIKEMVPFATIVGLISAIFLWTTLMPYFVHRSKHKISQRVSYYLSLLSSILLLGFSLSMIVNMLKG